jgi:hypothetical protein
MATFYLVLLNGVPVGFDGSASWPTAKQAIAAAEEICACGPYTKRQRDTERCAIYACEFDLGMPRFTGRDETEELCSAEAKARLRDHSAASIAADAESIVGPFIAYHASDYLDEVVKEIEAEQAAERGMSQRELVG